MPYTIDLSGRRALVTGGTRGIGLACAQVLGEAGAEVIIAGRTEAAGAAARATLEAAGHVARFIRMDVADEDDVVAAFRDGVGEAGVDIVVNNAGIAAHRDTLDADARHWNDIVDTNYKGVFLCCREALRRMTAAKRGGAIVNVGSISGIVSNVPQNQAVYNSAKAAVHMLTRSLASEFAGSGVRINAVAPGYVRTDMTRGGLEHPEWGKVWLDMTPMRRVAEPREIAEAVLFLASDLSSYVTGEVLTIDGGYTLR
ncbi:MAG: SDR family oxidoreductase [Gluconacetobacter diazotrophicus]|nr:SDR family oxidoreductase [Gluconacetobacter diazotrophicus]